MSINQPLAPNNSQPLNVGLLQKIQSVIREEPRRLYMDAWFTRAESLPAEKAPPCGTATCIGGWGWLIQQSRDRDFSKLDSWLITQPFEVQAYAQLFIRGRVPSQLHIDVRSLLLGYPGRPDETMWPWLDIDDTDAESAIRAIDRLIAKWAPEIPETITITPISTENRTSHVL